MKKLSLLLLPLMFLVPNANAAGFSDLYEEHLNQDAVTFLEAEGVVEGYSDGTYKPENRINRAEFTKIVIEAIYSDEEINACTTSSFPDVPVGEWFAKYVCKAVAEGIIGGYPDGTFRPAGFINFAEASKIVAEAQEVTGTDLGTNQEWFAKYVKGLEAKAAIPTTVGFFDEEITRGEMAEVIWRLEADKTDQTSATYEEITDPFPAISSCAVLEEKMTDFHHRPYYHGGGLEVEEVAMEFDAAESSVGAPAPTSNALKSDAADDFSQTNVQVEGVDEADIIKNDGEFIYLIKDDEVRIVKAYPGDEMEEVAMIDFDDDNFYPREMYVTEDRLVAIGWTAHYYWAQPFDDIEPAFAPHYLNDQSKVFVYDISDRSDPKELREVTFDGNYTTSRRIGDQVYLVLNAHPNYWDYDRIQSGEDFLPELRDGDDEAEKMVGCTDIRYFPGHRIPQFLITASIDISDADSKIDRNVFLGSGDNVYASRTHMYVASTVHSFEHFTDWDWSRDSAKTHVFRFALDDGDIDFKARGSVPGTILNQFSMDAYKDNFRIATTKGNLWDGSSKNNVYVLNRDMDTVGSIEDIAPGERIFSTRFLGDRLYMVTFRQVDPLFVIDLESPTNPKILGQLKIPGFSDYLHPFDENHIIGFGKETIEEKDFALIQGFKMALFDVSDPTDPKQKFVEVIGDRGTHSELLNNHKALLFDKEKELLAFPIQINEEDEELGYSTTTFSGGIVFSLNETDGFEEIGRISHYDEEDIIKFGDYWPYDHNKAIQRLLYIGEYLYSVAPGSIKSSDLDDIDPVDYLELED